VELVVGGRADLVGGGGVELVGGGADLVGGGGVELVDGAGAAHPTMLPNRPRINRTMTKKAPFFLTFFLSFAVFPRMLYPQDTKHFPRFS
jgi:hypothetical protein